MNKIIGYILGALGVGVAFVLLFLYGAWANAFVATYLWLWFVAPTFGLVPLTLPIAFGISLLIGFWTYQYNPWKGEDERDSTAKMIDLLAILFRPWFCLLLGWVCHYFFM